MTNHNDSVPGGFASILSHVIHLLYDRGILLDLVSKVANIDKNNVVLVQLEEELTYRKS